MSVELKGKLIQKLAPESGESQKGKWEKQQFVIETDEQFPRKICIAVWNDKVTMLEHVAEGDSLTVFANISSREFNTKWYTDVVAWRIERESDEGTSPTPLPLEGEEIPESPEDDLPF